MRNKTATMQVLLLLTVISFAPVAVAQAPARVSVSFDFRNGALGWQAGFADYAPGTDKDNIFNLKAEIRSLPPELGINGTGFYIQGANRSADLFMFLKRKLSAADGIVAGQTYQVNFSITFASSAETGCIGVGGPPGESVFLKAGASPAEPLAVLDEHPLFRSLRMNIPIGAQSRGGIAASVTGNIANGTPCDISSMPFVTLQRTHQHTSLVNASSNGDLWLLVGTDSGFEGFTPLYYQRIDVNLVPVSQTPPVLLVDQTTGRASAADSVTLTRDAFSVTSPQNFFSPDSRTRVTLFGYNLELKQGEDFSAITAVAEDAQHNVYALPIEGVRDIPKFDWIKGVMIKLPNELQGVGNVTVKLSLRGLSSNSVQLSLK